VIREYIKNQEEEDRRIDQLDLERSLPPLGGAINKPLGAVHEFQASSFAGGG